MAVVLNCRKLDPPKNSTAPHYIINLLGNKLVPRYFHTLSQFALFVLYPALWANKSYTFDGRCQIVFIIIIGSISFKILTFSVTSNRFGEGGFLLYPETPWCVMSLCHGARPTTSLYLTRRPHCPRLLLTGEPIFKDFIPFGAKPALLELLVTVEDMTHIFSQGSIVGHQSFQYNGIATKYKLLQHTSFVCHAVYFCTPIL